MYIRLSESYSAPHSPEVISLNRSTSTLGFDLRTVDANQTSCDREVGAFVPRVDAALGGSIDQFAAMSVARLTKIGDLAEKIQRASTEVLASRIANLTPHLLLFIGLGVINGCDCLEDTTLNRIGISSRSELAAQLACALELRVRAVKNDRILVAMGRPLAVPEQRQLAIAEIIYRGAVEGGEVLPDDELKNFKINAESSLLKNFV